MNAVPKMIWPPVKYSQTNLGGGITQTGVSYPGGVDLTTPTLRLQPGVLRDGLNFECVQSGGYALAGGYERYDGQAAPSDATTTLIQIAAFVNVPTVSQVVTQATTGATGTIVRVGQAPDYIVITRTTGSWDITHGYNITTPGPVLVGATAPITVVLTNKQNAQDRAAAANVYRALINPVPGSGPVRGVVGMIIGGVDQVYAFRDNMGGTATLIWRASPSGWVSVPLMESVSFTAGGAATPVDGATLTQGGVTATVSRVVWQSGAWTGTAAGQFVISARAGGNFAAGAATLSGGATVTLSGAQAAITIAPGGRFEFVKTNYSGQPNTRRMYGCDGVNKGFEFDGTVFAPIATGLSPDVPSHVVAHKNYLIFSQGASILGCAAGQPFKWSAVDGAWEIATGDVVNAMLTLPGSQTTATLGVFLRSNAAFLYGTDPTTFNFVTFNQGIAALPYSLQNLFDTFFFDDLGVVTLKTTLNWGNFLPSSLTKNLLPFVVAKRGLLTASSVNRERSMYRVFFSDGYGLALTMINQQYLGAIPLLFPNHVFCSDDVDKLAGDMATYFGASDVGYVFQLDKGTSYDGVAINGHITMNWDPIQSPRVLKRFRAASIEIQGDNYAEVNFGYQLAYANPEIGQPPGFNMPLELSHFPLWDLFTWDQFTWDGRNLLPTETRLLGTAENIQVMITSANDYNAQFILDSVIYHYTPRRGKRV